MRVLDTSSDGNISPVEWKEAWLNGGFQLNVSASSPGKKPSAGELSKLKLTSKHLSSSNLTELTAGQQKSSFKGKGKKVLPKIEDAPLAAAPSPSDNGNAH